MSGYHAAARAAAVAFMEDYIASVGSGMDVYRARPLTLDQVPRGFVEGIDETFGDDFGTLRQHNVRVTVMLVWGDFDSGDSVDQRDEFLDGFYEWTRTRYHQLGANQLINIGAINDVPVYVPDWLPPGRAFYGTQVILEGFATD